MLKYDYPLMFCITRVERDGELAENILVRHTGFSYHYLDFSDLSVLQDAVENLLSLYNELGLGTDEEIAEYNFQEDDRIFRERRQEAQQEKPKKEPKRDHLYMIADRDNKSFKIGRSINPEARLKSMQTASSHNLSLVLYYPYRGEKEQQLHDLLKEYRLCGEWFEDNETTQGIVNSFMAGEEVCYPYAE